MPKRRGDGEGSIDRKADGRYRARLRFIDPVTGYSRRLEWMGRTRQEVLDELDEARRRLRSKKSARDERITLEAFLRVWLDEVVTPTRREWTVRQYKSIIENHLIPSRLGSMKLGDIREVQIQHVLVAASKATPRIQQLCLIVLRRALEQARKWQMLETNPANGVAAPRVVKLELRVLSREQVHRFLEAAKADRLYALFYLALNTGMRQGELFALEWRDLDLETGALKVARTVNTATGNIGPPKTKASRRRIDLGVRARAVLEAHKKRMKLEGYSGPLVFPSSGGSVLSPSNVRIRSLLPIQLAAKIDPPVRFHDLRHTAATRMLAIGTHPKIASERLGHSTIAITMDTYQHVSETMQRGLADSMDADLEPPMGGKAGGQHRPTDRPRRAKKTRKR